MDTELNKNPDKMKKLIENDSYHLEVDDEAEINAPCRVTDGTFIYHITTNLDGYIGLWLITAHRPKGNAPLLYGVPLMESQCICLGRYPYNNVFCPIHGDAESPSEDDALLIEEAQKAGISYRVRHHKIGGSIAFAFADGYIEGYKAFQQSEKKYSKMQIIESIDYGNEYFRLHAKYPEQTHIDDFLQSLNNTKQK